MKQLLLETVVLAKQLLLLQGSREVYVLLALNSAGALVAGMIVGSLL
jgi:hypothetical protein|tara:strand:- start:166 stop:306 length:141 start_codon:yes stop_codon:yes gene_type:complete